MFLKQKNSGQIKGKGYADGRPQLLNSTPMTGALQTRLSISNNANYSGMLMISQ